MNESIRILVVDHEPKALLDAARILRSAGYEVLEATTGKEGLALAREQRPNLILLDVALSDISGMDLLKQIKGDPGSARTYVALLVREATPPAIQARGLENGADALILRTFVTRELLARIEAMLRRQQAEERLRFSVQEFRATFDAISDAVYLVDPEYKVLDCNVAVAKLLGKPRSEIVGGRCYELVHGAAKPIPACLGQRVRETRRHESLVVPMGERWLQVDVDPLLDSNEQIIGSVHVLRDITERRRAEEGLRQAQGETELRAAEHNTALAKANEGLQTEVAARQQAEEALRQARAELELRVEEHRMALAKADETLQAQVEARQRVHGVLLGAQAELELRAQEHQAALRQAEADFAQKEMLTAQVHQMEKMEGLRELARGIAEQFEKTLAAILGNMEAALSRLEPSHPLYRDLKAIQKAARLGLAFIRRLLAFSGRAVLQPKALDLNALITDRAEALRRTAGRPIELQLALSPELQPVSADTNALEEVLLNLAAHASTTMPEGGTLRLDTAPVSLSEDFCRGHPAARAGDYARLTAVYIGAKLAEPALEHIFEPQFAAGEPGQGSGLGLAVVYGLVRQLGGFVETSTETDEEMRLEVYLPLYHQGVPEAQPESPPGTVPDSQRELPPATAPETEAESPPVTMVASEAQSRAAATMASLAQPSVADEPAIRKLPAGMEEIPAAAESRPTGLRALQRRLRQGLDRARKGKG